jgi:predicted DCC family thiol-disulfide oxidoreductase YuxK
VASVAVPPISQYSDGVDVIYDGQCGFCVRLMRMCRAVDVRRVLRFHDANTRAEVHARFPALAGADFDNAMFVVTASGRVYRGFFACRRIAAGVPPMWPLLPLLHLPGAGWIGPKVYAWIAGNRHRFGCQSDVCDVGASRPRALRR